MDKPEPKARRRARKPKARKPRAPPSPEDRDDCVVGEHQSAPTPSQGEVPPASMALSPEGRDAHLLHSHREVWEDQLQWEEVRAMKLASAIVGTSPGFPFPSCASVPGHSGAW